MVNCIVHVGGSTTEFVPFGEAAQLQLEVRVSSGVECSSLLAAWQVRGQLLACDARCTRLTVLHHNQGSKYITSCHCCLAYPRQTPIQYASVESQAHRSNDEPPRPNDVPSQNSAAADNWRGG